MQHRIFSIIFFFLVAFTAMAQPGGGKRPGNFNPKEFEAKLEQYIATEAGLSPSEAAKFFPLYRQMRDKQKTYFDTMRRYRFVDINDQRASKNAIEEMDKADIMLKKIQSDYHQKFMRILPPGKVLKIIKAEDKFHRKAFHRMAKRMAK